MSVLPHPRGPRLHRLDLSKVTDAQRQRLEVRIIKLMVLGTSKENVDMWRLENWTQREINDMDAELDLLDGYIAETRAELVSRKP